jgi:hypothetical protein
MFCSTPSYLYLISSYYYPSGMALNLMSPKKKTKRKRSVGQEMAELQGNSDRISREVRVAKLKDAAAREAELKAQKIQTCRMDLVEEKLAGKKQADRARIAAKRRMCAGESHIVIEEGI